MPAIEVALARFREFRALEKEVADLKDALETRKLVDRAKGLLMDTQGLTEAEAFRKIQKMSMNSRKSMRGDRRGHPAHPRGREGRLRPVTGVRSIL